METPRPAQEGSSEESRNDFDERIHDLDSQLKFAETFCCPGCKQAPPCPRFVVTIRSGTPHSSLAVPGRFWELHGNMLESDELQLMGPNKAIFMVKAKRTYDEEKKKLSVLLDSGWNAFRVANKHRVGLDSGWDAFRVANKLRVGDILEFCLVGSSCFTVYLEERIEQY